MLILLDENLLSKKLRQPLMSAGHSVFKRLECLECAQAVLGWLKQNQESGTLLRLRTKYRDEFIVSSRWEQSGSTESISVNGIHYGVAVRGKVFDNLSFEGLV